MVIFGGISSFQIAYNRNSSGSLIQFLRLCWTPDIFNQLTLHLTAIPLFKVVFMEEHTLCWYSSHRSKLLTRILCICYVRTGQSYYLQYFRFFLVTILTLRESSLKKSWVTTPKKNFSTPVYFFFSEPAIHSYYQNPHFQLFNFYSKYNGNT